jgi:DNA repair exonuclease SbcCD ATPase subunit
MKVKRITLENFKGCRNGSYEFGEISNVMGSNGVGKTTIATAFYWVFADKDYDLKSNPAIRPLGVEECTPRVDIELEINGKSVSVAKFQKCTKKKDGAISLSNSYEVNSVEYGERDFKAKMNEYGFDFDLFLPLSHTEVFTSKKADEMRKVLFSMASSKSDLEIAQATDGVEDVAKMLENYNLEEIKAMQNSTIRKIKEDYGKDGEILRAKIEGLEMSKVDIDVTELNLHRNSIKEQIENVKDIQKANGNAAERYNTLVDEVMQLNIKISELRASANAELNEKRSELASKIADKEYLLKLTDKTLKDTERTVELSNVEISTLTTNIENCRRDYTTTKDLKFDENSLVCAYCGREYPTDEKDRIKAEFEQRKTTQLEQITKNGTDLKAKLENAEKKHTELIVELKEHEENVKMLNQVIAELKEQLVAIPTLADVTNTDEYKSLYSEMEVKKTELNSINVKDNSTELDNLQEQLLEVERKIALSNRNAEIDEEIENLQKKQIEYEQAKANAEKILYQLDLINKKKNEMLSADINSHFELVEFKLFDYLKNGDYKECCVPTVKGKDLSVATNTGLEMLMKLDIIKGLQKFYTQFYPVFLDGAECLSDVSKKSIDMNCQLIYLSVAECELKVEV